MRVLRALAGGQEGPAVFTSQSREALDRFSFHANPVLVVEKFLSLDERQFFRDGMAQAQWTALKDLPHTSRDFPNSGNWAKAEIHQTQGRFLMERLALPCIKSYVESFPNITGLHMGFSYYSYGAGDCLLTHDDTAQGDGGPRAPRRRLAVVLYLHEEWHADWGGELIVYESRKGQTDTRDLRITHCIAPLPGSLVVFSVPRFHRVSRVDPVAGTQKRLSIAGWFMTQHG